MTFFFVFNPLLFICYFINSLRFLLGASSKKSALDVLLAFDKAHALPPISRKHRQQNDEKVEETTKDAVKARNQRRAARVKSQVKKKEIPGVCVCGCLFCGKFFLFFFFFWFKVFVFLRFSPFREKI